MRIYRNFVEALNEIKRDLAEMGIEYQSATYQDKDVSKDPGFITKELQNYIYTVLDPVHGSWALMPTQSWADNEFMERISGNPINPGEAWKLRRDVWEQFLECPYHLNRENEPCKTGVGLPSTACTSYFDCKGPQFAYTYPERMSYQLDRLIFEAKDNPNSRQLYLSIWDPDTDLVNLGGASRVPCSLGYLFQIRNGKLHMTYFMRSCDYATHMQNDIYLAVRLMDWMAQQIGVEVGNFTHYIGSLHIFAKDVQGVF